MDQIWTTEVCRPGGQRGNRRGRRDRRSCSAQLLVMAQGYGLRWRQVPARVAAGAVDRATRPR